VSGQGGGSSSTPPRWRLGGAPAARVVATGGGSSGGARSGGGGAEPRARRPLPARPAGRPAADAGPTAVGRGLMAAGGGRGRDKEGERERERAARRLSAHPRCTTAPSRRAPARGRAPCGRWRRSPTSSRRLLLQLLRLGSLFVCLRGATRAARPAGRWGLHDDVTAPCARACVCAWALGEPHPVAAAKPGRRRRSARRSIKPAQLLAPRAAGTPTSSPAYF